MKLERWTSAALLCALAGTTNAFAQDGSVELPLQRYEELTQRQDPRREAGYAFSNVQVTLTGADDGDSADVSVTASVRVIGEGWAYVEIPAPGALTSATVDGEPAELASHRGGLVWAAQGAGTHAVSWSYRIEARRYGGGRMLSIPLPHAAARLDATIPASDPGMSVIPASTQSVDANEERTHVVASIPATGSVSIAWQTGEREGFTLSRAHYRGAIDGDSLRFEAELTVDVAGGSRVLVPLFPSSIALEDVRVDRTEAAIAVVDEGASFAAVVEGRGRHRVSASFRVPIERGDGLPRASLSIVPTPVCRFDMRLPGQREVSVEPHAGVTNVHEQGATLATFHVPMTSSVAIQWAEAVPADAQEIELRAHADLVVAVRPDEGVLSMRAFASFEITRGTTSRAELAIPDGVQINEVESDAGVVSDWRVVEDGSQKVLTIFLDREVGDRLDLVVHYERAWPIATRTSTPFDVPILRARGVDRQRGMIALLAAGELTLEPRSEERVTRVGDNLLAPHVRDALGETVAHTFRYLDDPPRLVAVGAVRPPEPARFDAQVDTLVSLGEVGANLVTMVELDVKSGAVDTFVLTLPPGLNVLEASAPSLRRYSIEGEGDARRLRVELTQAMEGRLTIEVLSERITGREEELEMPFIGVVGAEVERGRIGVEALAPFQVDVASSERLSPVDPAELPEQLLLRTDNPILHAYRYAQATPAPQFAVRITRHAQIQTLQATVEEAHYRTLYTAGGLAVTTARFTVRNRRQQFLRVRLPEGSEVWSARVDGQTEEPAEEGEDGDRAVLLNIVSAADAFAVELVYATPVPGLGAFGRVRAELPRLDVVVTRSIWELYLPRGARYMDPESSMSLVSIGRADPAVLAEDARDLSIEVPAEGVRYVFSKMYAGQGGERVAIAIPYSSGWGGAFVWLLSFLGAVLFWLGALAFAVLRLRLPVPSPVSARLPIELEAYRDRAWRLVPHTPALRRATISVLAITALGTAILGVAHLYLAASAWPPIAISAIAILGAIGMVIRQRRSEAAPPPQVNAAPPAA